MLADANWRGASTASWDIYVFIRLIQLRVVVRNKFLLAKNCCRLVESSYRQGGVDSFGSLLLRATPKPHVALMLD